MVQLTPFLVVGLLVILVTGVAAENSPAGVCVNEGQKIVGERPITINKQTPMPKKVRHVPITYPAWPSGTRASGFWMGEMLLNTDGKVVQVWAIREVTFSPPFPAFHKAIIDSILQWRFEPLVIKNARVPVCSAITMGFNWS